MALDRTIPPLAKAVTSPRPVPSPAVEIDWSNLGGSLIAFVRHDLAKIVRFAAVSAVTVPLGMALLWFFLERDMAPVVANLVAVSIATIPNYLMNRYWVWAKRGPNSVRREIAPFWAMAFLGLAFSTLLIWVAGQFTDATVVFLAANFFAFGVVWVLKFFVIEQFLFGASRAKVAKSKV